MKLPETSSTDNASSTTDKQNTLSTLNIDTRYNTYKMSSSPPSRTFDTIIGGINPSLERRFQPCVVDSPYHDLQCGHRIKTQYPEDCGSNCLVPRIQETGLQSVDFICQACLTNNSGVEPKLGDSAVAKDGIDPVVDILRQAEPFINERLVVSVKKMESGTLQFFDSFPEAHEHLNSIPRSNVPAITDIDRTRKRPGRSAGIGLVNKFKFPPITNETPNARGHPSNASSYQGPMKTINPTTIIDPELDALFAKADTATFGDLKEEQKDSEETPKIEQEQKQEVDITMESKPRHPRPRCRFLPFGYRIQYLTTLQIS